MKVLVACEFSGAVRDAFIALGHDAISCDPEPSESPGPHIQDRLENVDVTDFDMVIAFPPCTYLCSSGARWWEARSQEQTDALKFFRYIMELPVPLIAIENPVGIVSTAIRKPDQIIQPWMFGHGETKTTCLWLKGLRTLQPTEIVEGRQARIHHMGRSKNRSKNRSRTYPGIAKAMAQQWGTI